MIRAERVQAPTPLAISVAGQGPLVILVHGMGGDRSTWHAQIDALRERYTAASVELRGYGDSADPTEPLDFKRDFTADLLAVMDHFGVRRAHLVGLSMGGRVVRAACLRAPERVASLTLANTSPGFDAMDAAEMERFIAERSQHLSGGTLPADFGLGQARQMVAPGTDPAVLQAAAQAMQRLRPAQYLQVLAASTLQDRGDRLEDIACPTLVITSDQDRVYPDPIARQMLARLPMARHVRHRQRRPSEQPGATTGLQPGPARVPVCPAARSGGPPGPGLNTHKEMNDMYFSWNAMPLVPPADVMHRKPAVLIIGAGPVGLATALGLARHGVHSLVLETRDTISQGSRALAMTRRSMQILDHLGVGEQVLRQGLRWADGWTFYQDHLVHTMRLPQPRARETTARPTCSNAGWSSCCSMRWRKRATHRCATSTP